MEMGFQLNPLAIAQQIGRDLPASTGWSLHTYGDEYARPDFETGMVVHDRVDRAVVVFVGSRDEANAVLRAAQIALRGDES